MNKKRILIADFGVMETVRSSHAYDSYLLYSHLKQDSNLDVVFLEDTTPFQVYRAGKFDEYILHIWNYEQLSYVNWAKTQLQGKKYFIGYHGFKSLLNIPLYPEWNDNAILSGMKNLPNILDEMKYSGLMCDCARHQTDVNDHREFFPVFLSYGCLHNCSFCPVPVCRAYSKEKRLALSVDDAFKVTKDIVNSEKNIHFFDEDFFIDINFTREIIPKFIELQNERRILGKKPFKWIALLTIQSLAKAIKEFGEDKLIESGLFLAELGLESTDADVRKLMKKTGSEDHIKYIIENSPNLGKVWLMITFFPGETITSLNKLGEFIKLYGMDPNHHTEELLTNGSICGLGQFYQRYHGTEAFELSASQGLIIEEREPLRLIPSFIPNSLLNCKPIQCNMNDEWHTIFVKACNIYNLNLDDYKDLVFDGTKTIDELWDSSSINITEMGQFMIYIALMAKFSYIVE